MAFEKFIDEWAGKDWEAREWNTDEIGVFEYDKLTYFLTHNTGYVWVDQLDNTFAVETKDTVLSHFNLTNHDEYLGCALNVEFNGKYLLIGTHKFYPHPEARHEFACWAVRDEVKYKTGLCDKFCDCLLTLVGILNYQGKTDLKIRVIL